MLHSFFEGFSWRFKVYIEMWPWENQGIFLNFRAGVHGGRFPAENQGVAVVLRCTRWKGFFVRVGGGF